MYQALHATSMTLRQVLLDGILADAFLAGPTAPFTTRGMTVTLNTPQEMLDLSREGIAVWLYRVVRDEHRLNDPPRRIGPNQLMAAPLPVRLHYLVAPVTTRQNQGDPDTEQYLLGRCMQILHTHPLLRGADLQDELRGTDAQLNVRLESLTLEEITRIWEALEGSYQLSVSYEVSVINIETAHEPDQRTPVTTVLPEIGIIVGAGS
jgi:hypothetical protein